MEPTNSGQNGACAQPQCQDPGTLGAILGEDPVDLAIAKLKIRRAAIDGEILQLQQYQHRIRQDRAASRIVQRVLVEER